MNHLLLCTSCNEVLVKHMGQQIKVRGKIILFKSDKAFTVCPGCHTEVQIPVSIDVPLAKSLFSDQSRLYVENKKGLDLE